MVRFVARTGNAATDTLCWLRWVVSAFTFAVRSSALHPMKKSRTAGCGNCRCDECGGLAGALCRRHEHQRPAAFPG